MASELIRQELASMRDEVCPQCGGMIKPVIMQFYRGLALNRKRGSYLTWKCMNPECDQYLLLKSNTQIVAKYIIKKESNKK